MAWPANSIIEAKVHYRVNAQECINVTHWTPPGAVGNGTVTGLTEEFLDSFKDDVAGNLINAMLGAMSPDARIFKVTAQLIYPDRWAMQSVAVDYPGTYNGSCTAQNVQASIEKHGERGTRHDVGGFHLGGIPETGYDAGFLVIAYKAALAPLVLRLRTAWVEVIQNIAYSPVICNKEPIPNTDPVRYRVSGYRIVRTTLLQDTLRVMRRRTVGLGI